MSANEKQIGGSHYLSSIQPWDYFTLNGLRYLEASAAKYIVRNRKKHAHPAEDLEKAIHYIEKLREMHLRGLVSPRPAPVVITPEDFAAANDLTRDEAEIVRVLTFWETEAELTSAIVTIRRMLNAAQRT